MIWVELPQTGSASHNLKVGLLGKRWIASLIIKGGGGWLVTHTRNLCSAFNPSKCTHTAVNTHPEQWAANVAGARGAVGGSVPCSRVSPQSWYYGWRERWLFTPPTDNPCQTWDSNLQPLGYKSDSLTIRPRLPKGAFFARFLYKPIHNLNTSFIFHAAMYTLLSFENDDRIKMQNWIWNCDVWHNHSNCQNRFVHKVLQCKCNRSATCSVTFNAFLWYLITLIGSCLCNWTIF